MQIGAFDVHIKRRHAQNEDIRPLSCLYTSIINKLNGVVPNVMVLNTGCISAWVCPKQVTELRHIMDTTGHRYANGYDDHPTSCPEKSGQ